MNSSNNKRKLASLNETNLSAKPPISRSGLGYNNKPASSSSSSSETTISNYSNFVPSTNISSVNENIATNINAANNFLDTYINDVSPHLNNNESKPPPINICNGQSKLEQLKNFTRNEINNAEEVSDHQDRKINYNNDIISQVISNKDSIKWKNDVDYIKNDHVKLSEEFITQKNNDNAALNKTLDNKEIPVYKRVKVKDIVYARYSQDDYFYKAVILSTIHNGYNIAKYEVNFIDYNTVETISWRDIDLKNDDEEKESNGGEVVNINENNENEDNFNNRAADGVIKDLYIRESNLNQSNSKIETISNINIIEWDKDITKKDEDSNVFVGIPYGGIISILNHDLFKNLDSNWKNLKQ
jgi:hypothetical protein